MKKVKAAFRGIVIFLLCMIEVYPLFWMLTASFKKQAEWSEKPAYALNDGVYFQNYSDAWTRGHMSTFFKNSSISSTISSGVISSMSPRFTSSFISVPS